MLENGLEKCNCPKEKCRRHGKCEKCLEHHHKPKNPPYCKRKSSEPAANHNE